MYKTQRSQNILFALATAMFGKPKHKIKREPARLQRSNEEQHRLFMAAVEKREKRALKRAEDYKKCLANNPCLQH